jgi:hypothetical protein
MFMSRRLVQLGVFAAAVVLGTACDRLHSATKARADLAEVRQAIEQRLGSAVVEVRLSNATTLAVGVVNNPIQLRAADARRAMALELARVAYGAYAERARLGGVRVDFLARGSFALFTVSASEEHRFEPLALRDASAASHAP